MKKLSLQTLTTLFILLLNANLHLQAKQSSGILLDRIVAIVNDEVILKSNLDNRIEQASIELRSRGITVSDNESLQLKVLDAIILEKLQVQRASQRGIQILDEELLEQIAEIAKENKLTILQVRNKLNSAQPNGFAVFRENIRQQLLFQKLRQVEVLSQTQVTEDEINNYLQRQSLINNNLEYRLGHIIINLPESATPAQRNQSEAKAQAVLDKLNSGEDFSQIAVRHSQGANALKGGDLGWLKSDQIPTFFSENLNSMEVNDHSKLIKSSIGFHIIKLLGERDRNSKLVTQYHLYRFTLLSDDITQNTKLSAPKELINLAEKIQSLEDFKALKEKYPDMPDAINANTDLGWLSVAKIPKLYYPALQNITVKKATPPIASDRGWDILYLDATREKDLNKLNKRQQALQAIRMKKANETFEVWLRRLKDEALIDNRLTQNK